MWTASKCHIHSWISVSDFHNFCNSQYLQGKLNFNELNLVGAEFDQLWPNSPACTGTIPYIKLVATVPMIYFRIRTTPQADNSPPYRFWSWWVVLFCGSGPSGELSWWGIVLGIVVLVGNSPRDCGSGGQWLGFIFIWWGIMSSWRGLWRMSKFCFINYNHAEST